MSILSPYLVILERKTIRDVKLVRLKPLFFGIACSCTSIETKSMEGNVNCCVFMFLQFCKKKFAKVFEMENCLIKVLKRLNVSTDFGENDKCLPLGV